MNKTENIFNETVKALTNDVMSLQQKFHKLQEENNIKASIDCLRLLKETLALIREYDWHLEYSEYKTDGKSKLLFGDRITVEILENILFLWNILYLKMKNGLQLMILKKKSIKRCLPRLMHGVFVCCIK